MKDAKMKIRDAFSEEIKSEKTRMVCKCEDFFSAARSYFPSNAFDAVKKECESKCKGNTLEEDYIEDFDEEDY